MLKGMEPEKVYGTSFCMADWAGCASWLHEAPVAFGKYYVLLRVLKNDLGSGDERCLKRGICVTALIVWEVALYAVRHEGALEVVSHNLVVVNLDSDVRWVGVLQEAYVGSHARCGCGVEVGERRRRQRGCGGGRGRGSGGKECGGQEISWLRD
jgi:hypothetical protein